LTERVDCAVIGAGIVGLAAARALALAGREVLVLEAAGHIGTGISSRNSEVIHAGFYYPPGSVKARLCVEGNRRLRAFAEERGIPHRMTGKLVVATRPDEEKTLAELLERGRANGVEGLVLLSGAEARAMEPALACTAALFSPLTGIIDSHAAMLALLAEAEAKGAVIAFHAPVAGGGPVAEGMRLEIGGADPTALIARTVVIAAGLGAPALARRLGVPDAPADHLCKGHYFSLTGRAPFSRLVYPVPAAAGLGIHFTLDLAGGGRFGPDVEWIETEDYAVDAARRPAFADAIRRYWPDLTEDRLAPAYAGIRPKISGPAEKAADFLIHGPRSHGLDGVVALYGIESPGLTSCLALADRVTDLAAC
jgi:L-2-hydroxyglutarate oxidase LhgO